MQILTILSYIYINFYFISISYPYLFKSNFVLNFDIRNRIRIHQIKNEYKYDFNIIHSKSVPFTTLVVPKSKSTNTVRFDMKLWTKTVSGGI
jgi:hypothetical protein